MHSAIETSVMVLLAALTVTPQDFPGQFVPSPHQPPWPEAKPVDTPWMAGISLVAIDEKDSELTKLLKQRHNTAVEEVRARNALFQSVRMPLDRVMEAQQRLGNAGVEMAQSPAEKLKYLQMILDATKLVEKIRRERVEHGEEPVQVGHRATAHRLTAEIELLRARLAAAPATPGKTRPVARNDELQKLLKERFEATQSEARAQRALYEFQRTTLDDVLDAIQRQAQAGVELAQTPAERVQHLESALAAAKEVEAIVRDKTQEGAEPIQLIHQATYCRLDREIALLRARQPSSTAVQGPKANFNTDANGVKLRELLKERYKAASADVAARHALYERGRSTLEDVLDAAQRQTKAGIELATTPAERLKYLEAAYETAKRAEAIVQERVESISEPLHSLHQATCTRLDAQVALVRAGGKPKREPVER